MTERKGTPRGPYRRYVADTGVSVPRQTQHNQRQRSTPTSQNTSSTHLPPATCTTTASSTYLTLATSTPVGAPSPTTTIDSEVVAPTLDVEDAELLSEASEDEMDTGSQTVSEEESDSHLIYPGAQLSQEMSIVLILSYASRHKLTYTALGDLLRLLSLHFPKSATLPAPYRYVCVYAASFVKPITILLDTKCIGQSISSCKQQQSMTLSK